MSTATFQVPTQGAFVMNQPATLRPDLQAIVNKIQSLRALTEKTGFFTHRDIGNLLRPLNVEDMCAVSDALGDLKPREMPNNLKRFNTQGKPENFNR